MKGAPKILFWLSVVAAVLGAAVSVFQINTLYLAGTQWFIIAILLAVWSHTCENCGGCEKKE